LVRPLLALENVISRVSFVVSLWMIVTRLIKPIGNICIYMFNDLDRNKDKNDCQLRFDCEAGKSDPTAEHLEVPSRRTESYTQV
jgi:hypothetical protein